MTPPNASRYPAIVIVLPGDACCRAAMPAAGPPGEAPADEPGTRDAVTAGDADDDGAAPPAPAVPGSLSLFSGVWVPGAVGMTSTAVSLGPGWPGAGAGVEVSVSEGAAVGAFVGDGAGVVGRGSNGLSGTQTPPPPTGTWPAGHGSAAAAVAIVNTLTTTADHKATMPKTFRPVPTPHNATQLSEETRDPLAVASWGSAGRVPPDRSAETW
ncbi:hypothetical protein [Arthrobacter sp. ISL-69]|uniref:hypothetical protein n=1 Tax=Arthrobacter sp. ISL-69 TaxID=2819113 RepID=UPI001BEB519C|nr:hypothetical protein [Arthrobacter sp. ISL-69]MBT2536029.1 hypothetical protein [Arthrobacter sp. ISL-69]